MVNWKSKYLAMKLKYINAKQKAGVLIRQELNTPITSSVKSEANYSEDDIENFKNRLNGTPLENDVELIYNLYLVKKNIRKAFLFELTDFKGIQNVDKIIKESYPEFEYTTELVIEEKAHRILIHNPKLSQEDLPRENNMINPKAHNDELIATLLDFDCKGIPDTSNMSYTLHIKINDKSVIASICDDQNKFNIEKLMNYSKAAEELGYSFSYNIDRYMPDVYVIDKFISYMQTNDKSHLKELSDMDILNILDNAFFSVLVKDEIGIDKEILNLDFIEENKYLVAFILLIEKFEVFNLLYPLNNEQYEVINAMIMKYKTDNEFLNKNKKKFLRFINKFDEIFLQNTIDTGLLNFDKKKFLEGWFVAVSEFIVLFNVFGK